MPQHTRKSTLKSRLSFSTSTVDLLATTCTEKSTFIQHIYCRSPCHNIHGKVDSKVDFHSAHLLSISLPQHTRKSTLKSRLSFSTSTVDLLATTYTEKSTFIQHIYYRSPCHNIHGKVDFHSAHLLSISLPQHTRKSTLKSRLSFSTSTINLLATTYTEKYTQKSTFIQHIYCRSPCHNIHGKVDLHSAHLLSISLPQHTRNSTLKSRLSFSTSTIDLLATTYTEKYTQKSTFIQHIYCRSPCHNIHSKVHSKVDFHSAHLLSISLPQHTRKSTLKSRLSFSTSTVDLLATTYTEKYTQKSTFIQHIYYRSPCHNIHGKVHSKVDFHSAHLLSISLPQHTVDFHSAHLLSISLPQHTQKSTLKSRLSFSTSTVDLLATTYTEKYTQKSTFIQHIYCRSPCHNIHRKVHSKVDFHSAHLLSISLPQHTRKSTLKSRLSFSTSTVDLLATIYTQKYTQKSTFIQHIYCRSPCHNIHGKVHSKVDFHSAHLLSISLPQHTRKSTLKSRLSFSTSTIDLLATTYTEKYTQKSTFIQNNFHSAHLLSISLPQHTRKSTLKSRLSFSTSTVDLLATTYTEKYTQKSTFIQHIYCRSPCHNIHGTLKSRLSFSTSTVDLLATTSAHLLSISLPQHTRKSTLKSRLSFSTSTVDLLATTYTEKYTQKSTFIQHIYCRSPCHNIHGKVHSKVDFHSAHLLSISLPQHTRKSTLKSRLSFSTSTVDLLATTYTEKYIDLLATTYTEKSTFIQHIYCRSPCHNIHGKVHSKVDFHSAHLLSISLPQHTRKSTLKSRLSFSTSTIDLLATTYTEKYTQKSTFIQHIYCRSPCHNIHKSTQKSTFIQHIYCRSPCHNIHVKSRLSFSTSTVDLLATTYTEKYTQKSTFIQHIYCRSPCHNIHGKVHSKVDFHSAHLLSISLPQHTRKSTLKSRLSFSTSTIDLLATTYTEKYTQKSTFIQHIYCRSPCHNIHSKVHSKVDFHSAHLLSISLPQHTRKSTLKSRLSFSTSTVDLLATTYTEKYTQKSTFIQHIYYRSPCHNIHGKVHSKVDFHSTHLLSISLPQHTRKSRLSFSTSTIDLLATTYTEKYTQKSTFIQHIYCRSPCHNIHGKVHSKVDFHSAHLLSISLPQHTRKSTLKSRLSFSTSTVDLLATTYTEKYTQKSTFIQHIYCRSPCHNIHGKVHSKVDFHSAHLLSISLPQHTRKSTLKSRLSFSTSTVDLLATTYTEKSTFIQHIYCRSPCHNIHGKVHSKVDFHSAHLLSISLPQHTRKGTLKSQLSFSTSTVDLLATTYTEKSTFIQHIYCRSPCHNIHGNVHSKVDFHSAHLLSISLPQHTRKSTLKSRLSFSTSTVDLLATTYTEKSTFIQHIYCRSPCHNIHGKVHSKVDFHSAHLLSISLPQHTRKSTLKSRLPYSTSTVDLLATTYTEKSTFIQHIYCRSPCHNIHRKVHSKVDFHSAHLLSISLPQHTRKSTLKSRLSFSTSTVDLLATIYTQKYTQKSTFIQHIYYRSPCHNIHGKVHSKVDFHSAHLLSISLPQHTRKSRPSFSTSTVDLLATTYMEKYTQKSTFIQHIYYRSPCHNIHGKVHSKVDFHSAHLLSISLPQHTRKSKLKSRLSSSTSTVDLLATTYTEKYTQKSTFIQHIYCRSPCHNIHGKVHSKVDFHSAHLLSISLPQYTLKSTLKSRLSFSTSTIDLLATTYTEKYTQKSTFIQHIYCRSPCHNIHGKVDLHSAHLLSISLPQHTRKSTLKSRLSFSTSTIDLLATTYTEKYTQKSTFIQHIYCRSPCHNIHGKVNSKVDFHSAHLLSISLPQHTRKSTLKSRLSFSTSTVDLLATTYTEKSTFIQHIYCRSPCHNIHGKVHSKVDFHSAHLLSISLPQHTRKSTLKSRLSFSTSTVDLLVTIYTQKYTQKSTFIQHIYYRSPCHNIHGKVHSKVDFHSAHLLSISLPQHTRKSRPSFSTSTVDLLATTYTEKYTQKSTFIQHIYYRSPCHNIHGKVHSKVDFHSVHLLSISLPQHTRKSTLKSRLSFSTSTIDLLATTYTEKYTQKSTFIQHIYCRSPCHNIHGKVDLHSAHLLSISLPQHTRKSTLKSRLSFSTSTIDLLATTYTEKYTQKSTFIQHIYCRSPCHNIHGKVNSKVDFHPAHLLSISLPQHTRKSTLKSRLSFSTSTVDLLATTYTEKYTQKSTFIQHIYCRSPCHNIHSKVHSKVDFHSAHLLSISLPQHTRKSTLKSRLSFSTSTVDLLATTYTEKSTFIQHIYCRSPCHNIHGKVHSKVDFHSAHLLSISLPQHTRKSTLKSRPSFSTSTVDLLATTYTEK